jgi:hypothetical protein
VIGANVNFVFRNFGLDQQILGKLGQANVPADLLGELHLPVHIQRSRIERAVSRAALHAAFLDGMPVVACLAALARAVIDVKPRVRAPQPEIVNHVH